MSIVAMVLATSSAHAAVPAEASTALTGVLTDATALIAEGWPVIAGIVVSFVLFKIFKRVISAST
tara:strand:+ start:619 stop:813 length:195 start_codon:yes stop_codon:yes gene_type:complete